MKCILYGTNSIFHQFKACQFSRRLLLLLAIIVVWVKVYGATAHNFKSKPATSPMKVKSRSTDPFNQNCIIIRHCVMEMEKPIPYGIWLQNLEFVKCVMKQNTFYLQARIILLERFNLWKLYRMNESRLNKCN